jgi:TetR/AcrR family transcriptional repressor of nem operon
MAFQSAQTECTIIHPALLMVILDVKKYYGRHCDWLGATQMGVSKAQAAENRQVILDTASRIFRERGVDGVGVADLMKEAGFTHGGFYNHFKSKDDLAAEACKAVFDWAIADISKVVDKGKSGPFHELLNNYLSEKHRDEPGNACPTGALVTDAARQGNAMQQQFAHGIERFFETFALYFLDDPEAEGDVDYPQRAAMALLSDMVGTISLARGTAKANPALSLRILEAGRARLPA